MLGGRESGGMSGARAAAPTPAEDEPKPAYAVEARRSPSAPAGSVVPILTAVLAFLVGGIVVLATGHNPWTAYSGIFDGAGLNWFFHIPWNTNTISLTAFNLTQTLLQTTTLILDRARGRLRVPLRPLQHRRPGPVPRRARRRELGRRRLRELADAAARPARDRRRLARRRRLGGDRRLPEGDDRRPRGDLDDHAELDRDLGREYLFGQGGPLQNPPNPSAPESAMVAPSAQIPVFWGGSLLQGLDIGIFIAIAALFVFCFLLNRTTLGFEVRAVGFNPEAAAYGGINVKRSYIHAMAISGVFAGLAGALDMLGYLFQFGELDVQASQIGFLGIAVALLGRNTAVGVGISAFLFGALLYGTTRGLNSNVFDPTLAGNLTSMIQGLIVLFVGADLLILYVWNARRKLRIRRTGVAEAIRDEPRRRPDASLEHAPARGRSRSSGACLGVVAFWSAIPPFNARSVVIPFLFGILAVARRDLGGHPRQAARRLGGGRLGRPRHRPRRPRHPLEHRQPRGRLQREPRSLRCSSSRHR